MDWRSPACPVPRQGLPHTPEGYRTGVPRYGMTPQVHGEVQGGWGRVAFDVDTAVASGLLLLVAPVIMRGLASGKRR